jgi:hypothetical protein
MGLFHWISLVNKLLFWWLRRADDGANNTATEGMSGPQRAE